MKKFMKNISAILVFSTIITSCGEYGKGSGDVSNISVGEYVTVSSEITSLAVQNLRNVCSSLRGMRMDLFSSSDINSINYKITKGQCNSNSVDTYNLSATVSAVYGRPVSLGTSSDEFLETQLQTDQDGVLEEFCTAVFANKDVGELYAKAVEEDIVYSFPSTNEFVISKLMDSDIENSKVIIEKSTYNIEANSSASRNAVVESIRYESLCGNENIKVELQEVQSYQ